MMFQVACDRVRDAMDRIQDSDTRISDLAIAATNALGWQDVTKCLPEKGDVVMCTDGKARWMDRYDPDSPIFDKPFLGTPMYPNAVPTHWHPIQNI